MREQRQSIRVVWLATAVCLLLGILQLQHSVAAQGGSTPSTVCNTVLTNLLVNDGFEDPPIALSSFAYVDESAVPGWNTTASDSRIELWSSGFNGTPSYSGNQFAELNATQVSTLYQDIPTVPGTQISYNVAHRGRSGVDVFDIQIGPTAGPATSMSGGAGFADDATAWGVYTNTYVVPVGQTVTRFAFVAVSSAGGNSTGNFLDIEAFGELSIEACPDNEGTYTDTPVSGSAFANDASIDTITLASYSQPANGSVVMNPDGTYTYTPNSGFTGVDTYSYEIVDESGNTTTTTVSITVADAPLPILSSTKSVAVVGATDAVEGAVLRYTVTTTNTGNASAANTLLRDAIPLGTSYVPGSLEVTSANSTPVAVLTDNAGDDVGFYITGNSVGINAGAGGSGSGGGTFEVGDSVTYSFDVTINSGTAPGPVSNTAAALYDSVELGTRFTSNSNTVATPVATLADLSVTKSVDTSPITAGEDVGYSVVVSNAGPSDAQTVEVSDTLPVGMTLISATSSAGSCVAGSTSCDLGTLTAGSSATITYVVSADETLTDGSFLTNRVIAATTTPESDSTNNSAAQTTPVVSLADISVTKTADPSPIIPGTDVTWTITATNNGPSQAKELTIGDTIPVGTTLVSATPSVGACVVGSVNCALGDLAAGASVTVEVVASVHSSLVDPIANTVVVSSVTTDPESADNTSMVTTPAAPRADLRVDKSASAPILVAGAPGLWSYTVSNDGPSDARLVTSNDPAPSGISWTSASTTLGTCTTTPALISCAHGTIPSGASVTVYVQGDVDEAVALTATSITNTASATSPTADPDATNDSASTTTPLTDEVLLEATKVAAPDPAVAGLPLTYTVTVKNVGPSTASDVVVVDVIPVGTSFTSSDPSSSSGSCSVTGSTLTCDLGTIAVDELVTITVPVDVASGLESTALENLVAVTSNETDPLERSWTSTVGQQADMMVQKSAPAGANAGESVVWSFTVTNAGPSDANDAFLTDILPPGVTFVSSSDAACNGTIGGSSVACSWPTFVAGDSVFFTVTTLIDEDVPAGPLTNTAMVGAATPVDPTDSNNTSSAVTNVSRVTNLSLAKTGPTRFVAGTTASYDLVVTNEGPSSATDTSVVDTLPFGVTFDPANSDSRCSAAGALITCSFETMTAASSESFAIGVTVGSWVTEDSVVVNDATASTSTPEIGTDDNGASASTAVDAVADLVVTKAAPVSVHAGEPATWTVTLENSGPSDALDVNVSDIAPSGVTWTSIESSSALLDCAIATASCAAPPGASVPVGSVVTLTFTGDIDVALAASSLSNSASVASATTDPVPENNSETVSSEVVVEADLVVTKLAGEAAPIAGLPTTWTVTVTNEGPAVAADVAVVDWLPEVVELTAISTSIGICDLANGSCDLGDLAVGETATIGIVGLVDSDAPGGTSLVNDVGAVSTTFDPDPENNTASVESTLTVVADLAITKTAFGATSIAGENQTWSLVVANNGPSSAPSVEVVDLLPAQIAAATVAATTSHGVCVVENEVVRCELGLLGATETATILLTGQLTATSGDGETVANIASVSSTASDPEPSNNTATAETVVDTIANLAVTKNYTGSSAIAGDVDGASWEIIVANSGPSDALDVDVIDLVPSDISISSLSATQGPCVAATASCEVGTVTAGSQVIIEVVGTIDAGARGALINRAVASTLTDESDPVDNTGESEITVESLADLSVTKTLEGPIVAGGPAVWTVVVENNGPSVAHGVMVLDPAPQWVTWTAIDSETGSCELASESCELGDLPVGATVSVSYIGAVDPLAGEMINNVAEVSSESDDPNPANGAATVASPVGAAAVADATTTTTSTTIFVDTTAPAPTTTSAPSGGGLAFSGSGSFGLAGFALALLLTGALLLVGSRHRKD